MPFVVVAGDDERAQGTVTVKDLRTRRAAAVPRARGRRPRCLES